MLETCAGCTTAYAVGLAKCPNCGLVTGMAKINRFGVASTVTGQVKVSAVADDTEVISEEAQARAWAREQGRSVPKSKAQVAKLLAAYRASQKEA